MRIPVNVTYSVPVPGNPSGGGIPWRVSPERAVVLVHDMQRYFVDFLRPGASPHDELVGNTAAIIEAARSAGVPVVYTAQPGGMSRTERGLLQDIWGPGMSEEPAHREIVPELAPQRGEVVLTKWRYSAFARTDLRDRLHAMGRDQLVVCGLYAHIGCLMTTVDAFTADIQPFLVADATADFSAEFHQLALDYARDRCAATPATADLLTALVPGREEARLTGRF